MPATLGQSQADDLAAKSQLAKQLMASGNFGRAISVYEELNRAIPDNAGLRLNLGMALQMAGKRREAIQQLQRAVTLDPRLEPAWLFLGATHLQLGETAAAVKPLRIVLGLDPDQQQAHQMLADALLSLDRFQEAMMEYRKLTESVPESAPAWYGLGRCYESLASRTFENLRRRVPQSAYVAALLAETQLRQQQFSSAFFLFHRALEQMPTLQGLHSSLAEIY